MSLLACTARSATLWHGRHACAAHKRWAHLHPAFMLHLCLQPGFSEEAAQGSPDPGPREALHAVPVVRISRWMGQSALGGQGWPWRPRFSPLCAPSPTNPLYTCTDSTQHCRHAALLAQHAGYHMHAACSEFTVASARPQHAARINARLTDHYVFCDHRPGGRGRGRRSTGHGQGCGASPPPQKSRRSWWARAPRARPRTPSRAASSQPA